MSQIEINQPLVSVIVLVYNHEKYIADALDGILMQKVNFDYEIVLGEDCSTDKSREIIFKYAQKYPDKFNLILHEHNIGAIANQMAALSACTGKFIAFCEGDDYWTDPWKLHKQVNFLEENPEYSGAAINPSWLFPRKQTKTRDFSANTTLLI
jgi:glycosyltransferase involved in cell wall biosynthesis